MSDYDILLLRVEHQNAEIARLRAALGIAEKAMHRAISGGKISFRELDTVREALANEVRK